MMARGRDAIRRFKMPVTICVNARDNMGFSALRVAVTSGSLATLRVLLRARSVNVNTTDASGEIPLVTAVKLGRSDIVIMLLRRGGRCRIVDERGWTPLHWAAATDSVEAIKAMMMLPSGRRPCIDVRDLDEKTPLAIAARQGNFLAVAALVVAGARTDVVDAFGMTPEMDAILCGHQNVTEWFQSDGKGRRASSPDDRVDTASTSGGTPVRPSRGRGTTKLPVEVPKAAAKATTRRQPAMPGGSTPSSPSTTMTDVSDPAGPLTPDTITGMSDVFRVAKPVASMSPESYGHQSYC